MGLLPREVFQAAFISDAPAGLRTAENVLVGPLIAVLSFVCSVGNIPLAAVLWAGGILFAGVIAFIYADLITLPILLIYRKYYGTRFALKLAALMLAAMIVVALVVDLVFSAAGLVPETRPSIESITERGISLNYTFVLNVVFTIVGAVLVWLTVRRGATDPVCGMRVDRYATEHKLRVEGETVYFCSQAFSALRGRLARRSTAQVRGGGRLAGLPGKFTIGRLYAGAVGCGSCWEGGIPSLDREAA